MSKKSNITVLFATTLVLLTMACQLSEFINFSSTGPAATGVPRSNFVPPREIIQVDVGEPWPIESYHISKNKLGAVEIFVNGQPIRAEETSGQPTFPTELATVQALIRGRIAEPSFTVLKFPAATCRILLEKGGPEQTNSLALKYPSSTWSVCHIWIGHIPGAYDLKVVATDKAGQESKEIVQRIEVKKIGPPRLIRLP